MDRYCAAMVMSVAMFVCTTSHARGKTTSFDDQPFMTPTNTCLVHRVFMRVGDSEMDVTDRYRVGVTRFYDNVFFHMKGFIGNDVDTLCWTTHPNRISPYIYFVNTRVYVDHDGSPSYLTLGISTIDGKGSAFTATAPLGTSFQDIREQLHGAFMVAIQQWWRMTFPR